MIRSWLEITPPLQQGIIEQSKCKAMRDKLLAVLRGEMRCKGVDPPLPIPDMIKDEFNAYKKTSLQEYLYKSLFKNTEQTSTTSTTASLLDLPSLSLEGEDSTSLDMEELDFHLNELIGEVVS